MTVKTNIFISNAVLATLATAALAIKTDTFPGNGFFFMFGAICIAGGLCCLLLGLLLLLRKDKSAAKAYLLSTVVLLVIGLTSYFLLNKY